ncbi:MAG TPA: methyltransferase domain-containing protein [Acidobacteriota bacterium]|jgi:SAM-dependent methyltransferase
MPEIDLNQIMAEIRARAAQRRRERPEIEAEIQRLRSYAPPAIYTRFYDLEYNLHLANLNHNPALPPDTRFHFFKKAILRLIHPYTRAQVEFNASLVRAVNKAWEIIQEQDATMRAANEQLQTRYSALEARQNDLVEFVRTFNQFLLEDKRKEAVRKLTEIYENSADTEVRLLAEQNRRILEIGSLPAGFDYLMFEDRFRGPEAEIRERQRKYLRYFEHSEPILDIACGRGEFLELLRETGIDASGVESDPRMSACCHEKGLKVAGADLFDHLESHQDESLGGIFGAQFIEHLNYGAVSRLLALASRKLHTGGVLVLETVNPASLFVFAHSLYLDPTHVRPYHPLCLEFLCRNLGFARTEVVYGSPVDEARKLRPLSGGSEEFNRALQYVNDLLYGPQDYAVIAYK